jgi:ABC-2 type transport system ATP-binding protein
MAEERVTIRVDRLSKRYPGATRPAVDNISFSVHPGEVLGFVGPNGAGKTTTMKILTSYLAPSTGRAEVAGYDVFDQAIEARRRIGYLPEDTPLYKDMTVHEYLEWAGRMRQLNTVLLRARMKQVAEQCAIAHRMGDLIGELSKGYRQRVGLAQAILHDPEVLILDEPTSGLDPNQIGEIRNVIKEFGRTKTVIFSTHILAEVQVTCSRVLAISDGKIVADAHPRDLARWLDKERGMELCVEFSGQAAEAQAAIEKVAGVQSVRRADEGRAGGARLVVSTAVGADPRGEIAQAVTQAGGTLVELASNTTLEEVFRALTKPGAPARRGPDAKTESKPEQPQAGAANA